jgi:hypothetical protein
MHGSGAGRCYAGHPNADSANDITPQDVLGHSQGCEREWGLHNKAGRISRWYQSDGRDSFALCIVA